MTVLNNLPTVLYRYRSSKTDYFLEELERCVVDGHAFFNSVSVQNDPFDCNPLIEKSSLRDVGGFYRSSRIRSLVSDQGVREFTRARNRADRQKATKIFKINRNNLNLSVRVINDLAKEIRDDTKIISLSERWDSPLMWAHYAQSHSGVVVAYNVDWNVVEYMAEDAPLAMKYVSERPKINTVDILAWLNQANKYVDKNLKDRAEIAADALMFTKSDDWEYEKEWRVQKRFRGFGGYKHVPALRPAEIILGIDFPTTMRPSVLEATKHRVPIRALKLSRSSYAFDNI